MINMDNFHQLMSRHWNIVASDGLNPGQEIYCILLEQYMTNSYSHHFEKVYE